MKKILSLLALSCLCMAASAQITLNGSETILTQEQLKATANGAHFAMSPVSVNGNTSLKFYNGNGSMSSTLTKDYLCTLVSSGSDNVYYIQTGDGTYFKASAFGKTTDEGDRQGFTIGAGSSNDGTNNYADQRSNWIRFTRDGQSTWLNSQTGGGLYNSGPGGWTAFATFGPFYVAHIEYQLESTTVFEEDIVVAAGETTLTAAPAGYVFDGTPTINVSADGTKQVAVQRDPDYVAHFPDNGTYYMTIVNKDTSRDPYLYNSLQYNDDVTIQAASLPSPIANNNGYIWKVVSDGSGNITVKNGATGKGITPSGDNGGQEITSFQYTSGANAGYYNLINADKIGGNHDRLNCADNTNAYHNEANVRAVTTWNGAHNDNDWKFEEVDMTSLFEYAVEITGVESSARAYAEYNGQKALNGGFFLAATVEPSTVSARNLTGYAYNISVNNEQKTITVNYTVDTDTPDWAGLEALIDEADSYSLGDGLGKYRYMSGEFDATGFFTDYLDGVKGDFNGSRTSTYDQVETYKSDLRTMIDALSINQPAAGKFYLFQGAHTGNQKYMELAPVSSTDNKIKFTANEPTVYSYIYLEGTEGNFKMLGFGNGLYAKSEFKVADTGEEGGTVTFGQMIDKTNSKPIIGQYCIEDNVTHRWGHPWDHGYVQPKNEASQFDDYGGWFITEATSLPVALTQVGELAYASFNAPVAVTVPSGVTAYSAVVNGDVLELTAFEGTNLAANTPVILTAAAADTYDFNIVVSGDAFTSDLKGTTAKQNVAADKTTYVLNKIDDEIGFYKSETFINGFKAYCEVEAAAPSNALSFRFQDVVTAIEAIQSENNGAEIFDLQGRRLAKAQKGMNIINGHKVLVK